MARSRRRRKQLETSRESNEKSERTNVIKNDLIVIEDMHRESRVETTTTSSARTTTVENQESTINITQSNFDSPKPSMQQAEGVNDTEVPVNSGNLRRSERIRRQPDMLEYKLFE